jgi:queuine/archaeosine tRNA-ribosyltransferase
MTRIRTHIEEGTFGEFRKRFVADYVPWKSEESE